MAILATTIAECAYKPNLLWNSANKKAVDSHTDLQHSALADFLFDGSTGLPYTTNIHRALPACYTHESIIHKSMYTDDAKILAVSTEVCDVV